MKKDLPNFKITIDDEYSEGENLGIEQIAFTKTPAILTKGFAFTSQVKKVAFADNLKYRIAAPAMIPMEIYRCDEEGEYFVTFTSEEIEKIHQKFMANLNNRDMFNLEHDSTQTVPAYLLEAILVDSKNKIEMIKQEYGIDVPMGTSFLVSQITDNEYYNELVSNDQTGYSIEGFLGMKLSEIINNKNKKQTEMNELLNLPAGEYVNADGTILVVAEDGTFTVKAKEEVALEDAVASGDTETKMAEEVASGATETKMAEEVVSGDTETKMAEEVIVEAAPAQEDWYPEVETYTKEEVDAKFEELYKLIADLQLEEKTEEEEVVTEEVTLSQKFSAFVNFSKQ